MFDVKALWIHASTLCRNTTTSAEPMVPNAPAPDPVPSQAPQLAPAAPLPYTETRAPRGAPVEPMDLTKGERHTEPRTQHCRDPSIERLRDTAACSRPALSHSSSQDEEIDCLREEVKRLRQDRLSIQHEANRVWTLLRNSSASTSRGASGGIPPISPSICSLLLGSLSTKLDHT
jgi:hypothetical protein